jgi:hypothetical protein
MLSPLMHGFSDLVILVTAICILICASLLAVMLIFAAIIRILMLSCLICSKPMMVRLAPNMALARKKREMLRLVKDPIALEVMQAIKQALDPKGPDEPRKSDLGKAS